MNPFDYGDNDAMLEVEDFPACCTAAVIYGFGGELPKFRGKAGEDYDSAKQIIARCNNLIPELKNDGYGVVIAMTTSTQTEANKAFKRMGFYTNPKPMKKGRNKDTGTLNIWFMPTHEFKQVKL